MKEKGYGFWSFLFRLLGYSVVAALFFCGAAALYAWANPPLALTTPDAYTYFEFIAFFGCIGFWVSVVPIGILVYPDAGLFRRQSAKDP